MNVSDSSRFQNYRTDLKYLFFIFCNSFQFINRIVLIFVNNLSVFFMVTRGGTKPPARIEVAVERQESVHTKEFRK